MDIWKILNKPKEIDIETKKDTVDKMDEKPIEH
jgi:hypothetical protein